LDSETDRRGHQLNVRRFSYAEVLRITATAIVRGAVLYGKCKRPDGCVRTFDKLSARREKDVNKEYKKHISQLIR
ncbi:7011_t:CDS:2, partial [Ambispora leptoticha]